MRRASLTTPRKQASQRRSRATVDALVEATARILVKEGFDRASTNRIAEEAGVGIGSLYQYFPGKEALVAAVIDRHHREIMRVVRQAFVQAASLPLENAIRTIVSVAIEAHRIDPRLHRVLAEQIPRTGQLEDFEAFNREALALLKDYLKTHRDKLRAVDLDLAAFVCGTAIEAMAHTAVLHHPGICASRALVEETTRLIVGYLR
jgi:AcrR family transcriptional regulator